MEGTCNGEERNREGTCRHIGKERGKREKEGEKRGERGKTRGKRGRETEKNALNEGQRGKNVFF